jgi:hypothetical protein
MGRTEYYANQPRGEVVAPAVAILGAYPGCVMPLEGARRRAQRPEEHDAST